VTLQSSRRSFAVLRQSFAIFLEALRGPTRFSAVFSITPAKQVVGVECTVMVGFRRATMMSFPVTYE